MHMSLSLTYSRPDSLSQPRELEVDPRTGMKNYIANGKDLVAATRFDY
jgi:Heterokaryon incompatibility protein Het-C